MTHSVILVIQGIAERSSAIQKISCPCTAYLAKPNSHLHIAAASSWDRDNVDVAYAQRSVVKSNYFRWRCVIHTFITATANQYEVAGWITRRRMSDYDGWVFSTFRYLKFNEESGCVAFLGGAWIYCEQESLSLIRICRILEICLWGRGSGVLGIMTITDIFPLRVLGNRFKSFLPAILFAINRSTYFDMWA